MTRPEFGTAIGTLCAALDREMSRETAAVWFSLFERFPRSALEAAVLRYLAESTDTFLPAPGRLLRFAVEATHGPSETIEAVYGELCRIRREFGITVHLGEMQAMEHLTPRLRAVVDGIGGWVSFCDGTSADRGIEFAQVRGVVERMGDRERTSLALSGPKLRTIGEAS